MTNKSYKDFDSYRWGRGTGRDADVAVSTRVRFARNLKDYPFSPRLDETGAAEILERVRAVPEFGEYEYTDLREVGPEVAAALGERHLISPELAAAKGPRGLLAKPDTGLYIMLCEEDHVRIQAITAGLDLEGAYSAAALAEEAADRKIGFAFSEKFGYLTHCPTNLGTGMRASVMLFLPAIKEAGGIPGLQRDLVKLGLTVRGMSGEGSTDAGSLYQVSNQITLGVSEEETIEKLSGVVDSIINEERRLRNAYLNSRGPQLKDRVRRAVGTMRYAELMDTAELAELYGRVRLGIALGFVSETDYTSLDDLLFSGMPAGIIAEGKDTVKTATDRDAARAAKARTVIGG